MIKDPSVLFERRSRERLGWGMAVRKADAFLSLIVLMQLLISDGKWITFFTFIYYYYRLIIIIFHISFKVAVTSICLMHIIFNYFLGCRKTPVDPVEERRSCRATSIQTTWEQGTLFSYDYFFNRRTRVDPLFSYITV